MIDHLDHIVLTTISAFSLIHRAVLFAATDRSYMHTAHVPSGHAFCRSGP
jgi:hypothetical protein